jgi:Na+/H+-dicarboxylate symporter
MKEFWINNPWLVQIVGGIISGLVVGLFLRWVASETAKKIGSRSAIIK